MTKIETKKENKKKKTTNGNPLFFTLTEACFIKLEEEAIKS